MLENQPLLYIIIATIIFNLLLLLTNTLKISSNKPISFKLMFYSLIFSFNVVLFLMLAFYLDLTEKNIAYSYLSITFVLYLIHFILDEDWILRFDKFFNAFIMIILSIILYISWYFIMF